MPDTTVNIRYKGTAEQFSEVGVTGFQQVRRRGMMSYVDASRASALVATGNFENVATSPTTGAVFVPALVNWREANTRVLRANLLAGLTGAARSRIVGIGSSLSYGEGNNMQAVSATPYFAGMRIRGRFGAPNTQASIVGTPSNVPDRRRSKTGTATYTYPLTGCFGHGFVELTNAGDTEVYTPGCSFDRVDVGYVINGGQGSVEFSFDAGSTWVSPTATAGTLGLSSVTVTAPAGSTSMIARNKAASGGRVQLFMCNFRQVNVPTLEVLNGGAGASKASDWIGGTTYGGRAALDVIQDANALNTTIVEMGVNEALSAVSVSTFIANLTTLFNDRLAKGPVVFVVPYIGKIGSGGFALADGVVASYYDAALTLATSPAFDLPCIDGRKYLPDWTTANGLGWFKDEVHASAAVYSQLGSLIANGFESVI